MPGLFIRSGKICQLCTRYVNYVQDMSTMYKLFEYNFWRNCGEFRDKMDLTIQREIFNNVYLF